MVGNNHLRVHINQDKDRKHGPELGIYQLGYELSRVQTDCNSQTVKLLLDASKELSLDIFTKVVTRQHSSPNKKCHNPVQLSN